MKNRKAFTLIELMIVFTIIFFSGTWIGNVVRLVNCDFEPSYKAEIIYAIGVFTPTCVVTAFIDLEKDEGGG